MLVVASELSVSVELERELVVIVDDVDTRSTCVGTDAVTCMVVDTGVYPVTGNYDVGLTCENHTV